MNVHTTQATLTKIMVKKALNQIDYIQILVAMGQQAPDIKTALIQRTLGQWFDDMRIHLQRLEDMNELSIH